MTGVTHMLAATAIYKVVPLGKPIVLAMAFGSHFLLDAIPHYELSTLLNYILGAITFSFLVILAFYTQNYYLLVAAFLGALPDLNWILGWNQSLGQFHSFMHVSNVLQQQSALIIAEAVFDIVLTFVILRQSKLR